MEHAASDMYFWFLFFFPNVIFLPASLIISFWNEEWKGLFVCNELKLQRNMESLVLVIHSCLGTTGCYSKLWAPAMLFPAAGVLCLIIFATLMRLHFTASFSHNYKLASVIYILPFSRFLFHQKNSCLLDMCQLPPFTALPSSGCRREAVPLQFLASQCPASLRAHFWSSQIQIHI